MLFAFDRENIGWTGYWGQRELKICDRSCKSYFCLLLSMHENCGRFGSRSGQWRKTS